MHSLALQHCGDAPATASFRKVVKDILASSRFQHRLQLWHLIHDLGSNTKARFETTKLLRSNEGGLTLCYAFVDFLPTSKTLSHPCLAGHRKHHRLVDREACSSSSDTLGPQPYNMPRLSRPLSSNMHRSWTSFATTSPLSSRGQRPHRQRAVAKVGTLSKVQP